MKHTLNYILFSLALLAPVFGYAQDPPIYDTKPYNIENGIGTFKEVSTGMDSNGYYTLTLETFATGSSTVTVESIPSDIVLVLDLSTSMGGHRGYCNKISANTQVSIDDIESDDPTYGIFRDGHGFGYQISVLERDGKYYPYCVYRSYVMFYNQTAHQWSRPDGFTYENLYDGGGTIGNTYAFATSKTTKSFTFYTDNTVKSGSTVYEERICAMESSRIHELKDAVKAFIDEIVTNDQYKIVNGEKVKRNAPLHNKIGIVSFAGGYLESHSTTSMLELSYDNNTTNVTNVSALKNKVDGFTLYDGTKPTEGLEKAKPLFANSGRTGTPGEDFLRTVVFFTDGKPDDEVTAKDENNKTYSVYPDCYNKVIEKAADFKVPAYGASMYSVGLFSMEVGETSVSQDKKDFMDYVSSDYPDALSTTNHGDKVSTDYYKDVSTGDLTLSDVFKTIAQASGGSERTVPGATQVVDGLTNSFTLPKPANGSTPTLESIQVRVYTRSINTAGTDWKKNDSGKYIENNLTVVEMPAADTQTPNPGAVYMTDDSKVGVAIVDGKLYVMGFNYSKLDDPENSGNGNWVGWRYPIVNNNPVKTCYGQELVIEFKIQGDPTATGGNSTQTNTANSGVYVPKYKEDGTFDGYEVANSYEIPDADIPINLVIKKSGLKHGESATIQIYWAPQKDKSDPNNYDKNTGKLKPDLDIVWDGASADNGKGWGNFSKVILTNTGVDGAVVTETLLCLDPNYVYKMAEDNWGWSYTQSFKEIDTSEKEFNPFEFTNTKKDNVVRHAEAASINYFTNSTYSTSPQTDKVKSKEKLETPASSSGN